MSGFVRNSFIVSYVQQQRNKTTLAADDGLTLWTQPLFLFHFIKQTKGVADKTDKYFTTEMSRIELDVAKWRKVLMGVSW